MYFRVEGYSRIPISDVVRVAQIICILERKKEEEEK